MKTFVLSEEQEKKLSEWKATLPRPPANAIGGAFTYCFTPTSLGVIANVIYYDGQEIDLTCYGDW